MVNGDDTNDEQRTLPEYFPIVWKKSGFSMGLYLKGTGVFSLQLSRQSPSILSDDSKKILPLYSLKIDFIEKKIVFLDAVNENIISKQLSSNLVISVVTITVYWFEMRCSKTFRKSNHYHNCFLCFGKSGDTNPLIEINIGNPFKELHVHPTFVSFIPKSIDTSIQVSFECSRDFGDVCAHTGECKKTDINLLCGNISKLNNLRRLNGVKTFEEDRCICRSQTMKWDSEMKKCVTTQSLL